MPTPVDQLISLIKRFHGAVALDAVRYVDRSDPSPAYLVGLIPLLIGVALLAYTYVLAPKH